MAREWTDKSLLRVEMEYRDSTSGYLGKYEEHSYLSQEKPFATSIPGKEMTLHETEASAKKYVEDNT